MRISVIIPVLDEAARIRRRLDELSRSGLTDVTVVDGGSTDRTADVVRADGSARLISAPRGRGPQMNAGAQIAQGEVLLFLHADCALPSDARGKICDALSDPGVIAGAFHTWTVPDEGDPAPRWAPWLHLADLRSRYTRLPYGDQALFVRAAVFRELGGYPALPIMEDLELARRLRRRGRIQIVSACVRVSGRRFLAHPIRAALLVNLYPLLYRAGIPARTLARFYRNTR